MNIALIYPENDICAFGIRSISAVLKQAGFQTKVIIVNNSKNGHLDPAILEQLGRITQSCQIVGLSCFSQGSDRAIQICQFFKKSHPEKIIAWGGIHATMNPSECAVHADVVCVGEGEEFTKELACCVQHHRSWEQLPNAAFIKDGVFRQNELRPLIPDLDDLPFFDFSFDEEYHSVNQNLVRIKEIKDATIPIMYNGTRGCAFSCNYCSNSQIKKIYKGKGRYVRKLSPGKYIEALTCLRKKFPEAKYCNLVDEDFFAYPDAEIGQFADLYRKHIQIPFECMGSPRNLKKENVEPLAAAGLWRVNIGVESGSERTKKEVYNRHITNEEVVRASKVIAGFKKIILNCFIIIGNPYETNADLARTIDLFKQMTAPFFLTIYNLIFFPGTLLYQMAVNDRIICGKTDSGYEMNFLAGYNYQEHGWKTKNLYLNGLIYLMMGKVTPQRMGIVPRIALEFLLHPKMVALNEKYPRFMRGLIFAKQKIWRLRSALIRQIKRWAPNPAAIRIK